MSLALRWSVLSVFLALGACSGSVPIGAIPDAGADASTEVPSPDAGSPFDAGPELPLSPVASLSRELRFGAPRTTPGDPYSSGDFRLAGDGDVALVAWVERHEDAGFIKSLRIDRQGRPLDAAPNVLAFEAPRTPMGLVVAGGDGRFLLAWVEATSPPTLRAASISGEDGTLVWGPESIGVSAWALGLSITSAGSDFLIGGVAGSSRDRVFVTRVQPSDRYRHQSVIARRMAVSAPQTLGSTAIASDGATGLIAWDDHEAGVGSRVFTRTFEIDEIRDRRTLLPGEPETLTMITETHGHPKLVGAALGASGPHVFAQFDRSSGPLLAVRRVAAPAGELSFVHTAASGLSRALVRGAGDEHTVTFDDWTEESARYARLSLDASAPPTVEEQVLPAGVPDLHDVLPMDSGLLYVAGRPATIGWYDPSTGAHGAHPLATTTIAQRAPRALRVGNAVFVAWQEGTDPVTHRGTFLASDGRPLLDAPLLIAEAEGVGLATDGHSVLAAWSVAQEEGVQVLRTRVISPESGLGSVRESTPMSRSEEWDGGGCVVAWDGEVYEILVPARVNDYFHHHRVQRTADGSPVGTPSSMRVHARFSAHLTSGTPWLVWPEAEYARPIGDGRWEWHHSIEAHALDGAPRTLVRWTALQGDSPRQLAAAGTVRRTSLLAWTYEGDDGWRDVRFLLLRAADGVPEPAGEVVSLGRPTSVAYPTAGDGPRSYLLGWASQLTASPDRVEVVRIDTDGDIVTPPDEDGVYLVQEGAIEPSIASFGPGRFLVAYTRQVPGLGTEVRARIADYPLDPFFIE